MSDIRRAVRALTSQPAATTVVVLTIAATTMIYSVIDLVWRFIPIVDRSRLVYVASTDSRVVQAEGSTRSVVLRTRVSIPDLADWSAGSSTVEQFAALETGSVNLTGIDVPVRISSVRVTANLVAM